MVCGRKVYDFFVLVSYLLRLRQSKQLVKYQCEEGSVHNATNSVHKVHVPLFRGWQSLHLPKMELNRLQ
eukprot:m.95481 g.95481  ORF g.95481 m.95481 type:complete len:69 (+) comp26820_c1_seq1:79-285(+)